MKKVMLSFLSIMTVFITLFNCFGCVNRKYDVTIRVGNNYNQVWDFTPDIDEMTYEFEYTGEEMKFYVRAYKLVNHPRLRNKWLLPQGEGADVFSTSLLYTDLNGKQSKPQCVKDRGTYVFRCTAGPTSDLWNYRTVRLTITVI